MSVASITFASIDDAFTATALPVELWVRVGDVAIDATEASVSFGVDRAVGTCTVYCAGPRPASAEMNATIEIEMGYPGASARRFIGFIPSDESVVDDRGRLVRIEGVGWASRLTYPEYAGIEIEGPVSLKDAFRSLMALRSIPTYLSDDTTTTDGMTTVMLGGNDLIDSGHLWIDNRTDPLSWLQRIPPAYGYRVFDSPDGSVRMARVSGLALPNDDETPPVFEEGVNCFRISHERNIRDMATYIEVKGARYTGEDGGTVEIRSIPDEVPYAAELDPPGYRKHTVSLQDIVTDEQAEWVRNATEVDRAATFELISWEAPGRADLQPGNVVTIHAPTHGIAMTDYWLMSVDESVNDHGYIGRYSGWRGAGEALAAGNDCRTESVGGGTIHAGTETISYYRDPSPDSVRDPREADRDAEDRRWVVERAITVTDADYSSLRLTGICHGTNSINNRTAITGSKVEVWQLEDPSLPESGSNEERRAGSMDLPTVNEEISKRRNYASSDRYWTPFSLPLPGTLKEGAATLVIVCGESDDGEVDDFELDDLVLTYCGVGTPTLPGSLTP
jgi:hypothetical protein